MYSASERNNRAIFLERLGTVYRDQNKTQLAVDTFRKMVALGDDSVARGYQQIIETYRDAKNWPAATAAAREAVAKLPNDRGLQMVLAGQEADSGDADAAIARVKAMLKGKPADDREVWIALAQMYSRLRRYPDAEKALAKALELSTKQEEKDYANFIAGSIYERQKKYDEAESYFRKVLASDPKNATALNYLGYMLADRGTRLDESLSLIRRAVALDPQNGAYLDSLGWVHYKMGKYDLAEAASAQGRGSHRQRSDGARASRRRLSEDQSPEARGNPVGALAAGVEEDDSRRGRSRRRSQGAEETRWRKGEARAAGRERGKVSSGETNLEPPDRQ